ncbi:MAG: putative membrane chloride channel (bestrophin family) [Cognaticolwellia sp.]|jgi:predicted membrane chloride channel (bestrophin family)
MTRKNRATQILHNQAKQLKELYASQHIEDFRHIELMGLIEEFYTLQGKCERIKNFPLPRQYASLNHWFAQIFVALLPFGLLGAFAATDLPPEFALGGRAHDGHSWVGVLHLGPNPGVHREPL